MRTKKTCRSANIGFKRPKTFKFHLLNTHIVLMNYETMCGAAECSASESGGVFLVVGGAGRQEGFHAYWPQTMFPHRCVSCR